MNCAANPRNFVPGNSPPKNYPQFERSPESFPDLTIFPPGWDMSEMKPTDPASDGQVTMNMNSRRSKTAGGEEHPSNETA